MSNHLAIAAVTAVLSNTLQDALDSASPGLSGARATTARPNAPATELPNPGVNIFLYQATPSAGLRNSDLPRVRGDGSVAQRPVAALDLHYLISFHGNDGRLEPQILHGITVRALHGQPVMTREAIERALTDPLFGFLDGSDLAEAVEIPRFSPVGLSLEELSKLWSVMLQTPYVLSVTYRASVVLIESEVSAEIRPPVRAPRLGVMPSTGPSLEKLLPESPLGASEQVPVVTGQKVVLAGRNLLGPVTRVRFDGTEVAPESGAVGETRIQLAIPAFLCAGVHGVQVVQRTGGEASAFEVASNVVPFVVLPTIQVELVGSAVRVALTPSVERDQHVTLLLNQMAAPPESAPRAYSFQAVPRPSGSAPIATLDIPIDDVAPGSYLVRVQVDGAESLLTYDEASGRYSAPQLTLP